MRDNQTALSVAIMAGGRSSRMGQDKSFVPFEGRPMIETITERVTGLGDELFIVTNNPDDYAHLELPLFSDVFPDHGSLGGIYTAVHHARHPHTLIVACDMPWLNRPFLEYMISLKETADIIVPRWNDFPEPLHAIYHKVCLPPIEANLRARRLKIIRFYDIVSVRYVEPEEIKQFDSDGRSFANINTPQDLTRGKR
jgi:molybdopterin-guanine dinucleotide biosynthesis protein A